MLDSPEMKSAERLNQAHEKAGACKREFERSEKRRQDAAEDHQQSETERDHCANRSRESTEQAEGIRADLGQRAAEAEFTLDEQPNRTSLERTFQRREKSIGHLIQRNRELESANRRLQDDERELERRRGDLAAREQTAAEKTAERTTAVDEFAKLALKWETDVTELKLDGGEDWRESTLNWLEDRAAPFPFEYVVAKRFEDLNATLLQQTAELSEQEKRLNEELDALESQLTQLDQGRQPDPPAVYTHNQADREKRAGAPLWKACEFRSEISESERAGYEAALESAGILDAWIQPDGKLVDAQSGDVFLVGSPQNTTGGLNAVLRADGDLVPQTVVAGVLAGIGVHADEGATWINAEGRWQNGPLSGDWSKPEAEFIGYSAREKARLRRIAELESERDELKQSLTLLRSKIKELDSRRMTLVEERDSAPKSRPIDEAALKLETAEQAVDEARVTVNDAESQVAESRRKRDDTQDLRDRDAEDFGLTNWREPDALERLKQLMNQLQLVADRYWISLDALDEAIRVLKQAEDRLHSAQSRLESSCQELTEAQSRHVEAQAEYMTLKETHGKSAEEVLRKLSEIRSEIQTLKTKLAELREAVSNLNGDVRLKQLEIEKAKEQRAEREITRNTAVEHLHVLSKHELLGEAAPELQPEDVSWNVTRAVEISRRAEHLLSKVESDDAAWSNAQTQLQSEFQVLSEQLGMRDYFHPAAVATEQGAFAITVSYQGQDRSMSKLAEMLTDDVHNRETLLDEREREIIENHLIGEVATVLQARIREGENWVREMNDELDKRPTSSGIKLKFDWIVDPDGAPGLAEARQQLLKTAATWSVDERNAIGGFLHDQIRAQRAENQGGSWPEHLTRALDYRTWHQFRIFRHKDGNWGRLTKRTHGTQSTGEKAMTLTMPQFAAAAAHYQSASDIAPRLIMLDEVFASIDGPARAELMGLLNAFDLDIVMTSEREWGCYATVPSLAIYQLASGPQSPAVHVTRWIWNGKEMKRG